LSAVETHPLFARFYQLAGPLMELGGMGGHRRDLLAGLTGEVIEVGAGTGLNFEHYPAGVTRVLGVEPEPRLRQAATRAAARAPVQVDLADGVAERLPAEDASFDAAVVCLVLCSVADPATALGEIRRVLRPGGQLRFLEHVGAPTAGLRRVQGALDATVWPHLFGGCHLGNDTEEAITAAGFEISRLSRIRFPSTRPMLPSAPHICGAASCPAPEVP
jgi:ubiquinone/menaquinone biosynthesis C-methylase UbiE